MKELSLGEGRIVDLAEAEGGGRRLPAGARVFLEDWTTKFRGFLRPPVAVLVVLAKSSIFLRRSWFLDSSGLEALLTVLCLAVERPDFGGRFLARVGMFRGEGLGTSFLGSPAKSLSKFGLEAFTGSLDFTFSVSD